MAQNVLQNGWMIKLLQMMINGLLKQEEICSIVNDFKKIYKLDRDPYLLETSIPGIFAAGDVSDGA